MATYEIIAPTPSFKGIFHAAFANVAKNTTSDGMLVRVEDPQGAYQQFVMKDMKGVINYPADIGIP